MFQYEINVFDVQGTQLKHIDCSFLPNFEVGHTFVFEEIILNRVSDVNEEIFKKFKILEVQHKFVTDHTGKETYPSYSVNLLVELLESSPE